MSHNGKDTSGNSFKFSLIPLMLGIVLIFFLYRSCGNSTFEAKPSTEAKAPILEEELSPEQPVVKVDTTKTVTTEVVETVVNDTVQAAE